MRQLFAFLLSMLALVAPLRLSADPLLERPFRAADFTSEEIRHVQAFLALEGRYVAVIDGKWGAQSQDALAKWAKKPGSDLVLADLARLFASGTTRFREGGWKYIWLSAFDISLMLPERQLHTEDRGGPGRLVSYEQQGSSLAVAVGDMHPEHVATYHAEALQKHRGEGKPYVLRGNAIDITEIRHGNGRLQYIFSMRRGGAQWSLLMSIWADQKDYGLLNLVATSIRPGHQPELHWNTEGLLGQVWQAWTVSQSAPKPAPETTKPAPAAASAASGTPQLAGSGSGFHVSASGHVLTNSHVIEGCSALRVDGRQAVLKAANTEMDLALLLTAPSASGAVAAFRDQPAGLNADVTVVGFPLSGLLGGLNVTRGAVSSLTGIRGDLNRMQISAPVQPGNSGGPVVAPDGGVVGVVVSKLDAIKAMENIGDIPQNVNFAIRGEMAQLFLSTEGLVPTRRALAAPLPPEALAKQVASWTVRVECWR